MINEITINFNNTIEMSRGQLLNWVNDLLKTNLTKIQQLGTGAIYCQLTDVLYPNKIPLAKVNWKAKYDYEFVNNFKVLQLAFTKLGIMKNVEIQKLVKCKYQDNLEFLQWFKKIFDNSGNPNKDYNAVQRRETELPPERKRESKISQGSTSSKEIHRSNSKSYLQIGESIYAAGCASFLGTDRTEQKERTPYSTSRDNSIRMANPPNSPEQNFKQLDSPWKNIKSNAFQQERQFYLKKFKEIQHLCEEWKTEKTSLELIEQIRKIIFVTPQTDWKVQNGQFVSPQPEFDPATAYPCDQSCL